MAVRPIMSVEEDNHENLTAQDAATVVAIALITYRNRYASMK